jgi:hypothetical protein
MDVTFYPDTLSARYPISIPTGIALTPTAQQDYFRSINVAGNRVFVEFSTTAINTWMHVDKVLLTGRSNPWSSLNPTGGGSTGITIV